MPGWNRGKYAKASRSRATHKRANGRLPNRSIICRNKESKAYAAAVTPRREPAAGRVRHRKPCSRCVRPAVPGAVAMSDVSQTSSLLPADVLRQVAGEAGRAVVGQTLLRTEVRSRVGDRDGAIQLEGFLLGGVHGLGLLVIVGEAAGLLDELVDLLAVHVGEVGRAVGGVQLRADTTKVMALGACQAIGSTW